MRRSALCLLSVVALAGCGYVGAPLPPALNIPEAVTDLRAVQRGERILATFTPPAQTTDRLGLKAPVPVELHLGPPPQGEFNVEAWAGAAEVAASDGAGGSPATIELPVGRWAGREVVVGLRSVGPTGRRSAWSNLVVVRIVPAPVPPASLRGRAVEEGVYLQWDAGDPVEGKTWRVYRKAPGQEEPVLLGVAGEPSWLDRTVSFGERYSYWVQTLIPAGESQAESEPGEGLTIEPRDTFPPAAPEGLTVIAGVNTIELAWERNAEADLAGYQVWRAEGDGGFARLGDPVTTLSFSDTGVTAGRRYWYALSARDSAGNESARGAPVEVTAP